FSFVGKHKPYLGIRAHFCCPQTPRHLVTIRRRARTTKTSDPPSRKIFPPRRIVHHHRRPPALGDATRTPCNAADSRRATTTRGDGCECVRGLRQIGELQILSRGSLQELANFASRAGGARA